MFHALKKKYQQPRVSKMSENVRHDLWVDGSPALLRMANIEDGYYMETFHNWSEVESFIKDMREKAEMAFGPNPVITQE